jgi:hypothetical protein
MRVEHANSQLRTDAMRYSALSRGWTLFLIVAFFLLAMGLFALAASWFAGNHVECSITYQGCVR